MYVMPNSTVSDTTRESARVDFSHSLLGLLQVYAVIRFRRVPMRLAFRISLLAIGLASVLGAGAASAGSVVEFPNVSAQEPKLLGYLARPTGEGPFPAVVVLHGCEGFSSGGSLQLADQLEDW